MPLAYQLESIDSISDEQKKLYKKSGDSYVLDISGEPQAEDVSGLKAKLDELMNEKKNEAEKRRQAEEKARLEAEEAAKKKGDFEALAKSYQEKIAAMEQQVAERDKLTAEQAVQAEAQRIAGTLSEGANQNILSRFIGDRLRYEDGSVKVTDKDGNLTISTLDQLSEEFKNNQEFASLIIATRASGGGAFGSSSGGGAAGKNFNDMNETERVKLFREHPEEFKRLSATE